MAQYPKSKWVDDAYLMWAKALLGKDDPIQTVNMLQDFGTRFRGAASVPKRCSSSGSATASRVATPRRWPRSTSS
jgi:hypothetical protein